MSELIDRKRFSADMRDFQNRVGIWRDEAEDTETRTRADAALATIIETKLILDKQPTVAAASPWHRVEEELPEEKDWVLVWHTGYATPKKAKFIIDVIPEFVFDGGGGAWELDGWSDNEGKVTHWMPLPEPPKEGE